jgi:hypothetical protein
MKYVTFLCMAVFVVAFTSSQSAQNTSTRLSNCDTTKPAKSNKKEPIFDYPDYIDTDTGRASFVRDFAKGRIVYKQVCAKCHNVKKDGKLYYPDFSIPQLVDYEMRIQYPAHQEELKENSLSAEEFDWVVLFLQFKKKNLLLTAK